uniref:Trefoil factor 2 n=1 Tax=Canis lupus familiaris TaxID=9615 RepID=A0A8P0P6U8_CANLF
MDMGPRGLQLLAVLLALGLCAPAGAQKPSACQCSRIEASHRKNCGFPGISAAECFNTGCCFDSRVPNVPWCFHPLPKQGNRRLARPKGPPVHPWTPPRASPTYSPSRTHLQEPVSFTVRRKDSSRASPGCWGAAGGQEGSPWDIIHRTAHQPPMVGDPLRASRVFFRERVSRRRTPAR